MALLTVAPQISTATAPRPYSLLAWQPMEGKELKTTSGATLRLESFVDLRKPAITGEVASDADRFQLQFKVIAGTLNDPSVTINHPTAGPVNLFTVLGESSATASIDQRGADAAPITN